MPSSVVQAFAKKSGKDVAEVEKLWHELKDKYGEDYEAITGTLKKILQINEDKRMKFRELLNEKREITKEDVVALLVKYGNNPKDAQKMADAEFEYAKKTYPNATASKLAEIISTISENSVNEANYEIKDGKVLITKDNYKKKHKDYKGGKKGAETLLVLDPKSGATVSMPVEFINEEVQGIDDKGIGYVITKTLGLVGQSHAWHLTIKSGQKHTALNELYTTLQDEVDGLAEKFIAQGGTLTPAEITINPYVNENQILSEVDTYRNMISSIIDNCQDGSMASILDGLVDLQECIDSFVYKFKLD